MEKCPQRLERVLVKDCEEMGLSLEIFQSNSEGA